MTLNRSERLGFLMNELIMVVVLAVYVAGMYFMTGFFIVGEDICLLPTREKTFFEKWVIKNRLNKKGGALK